jgi:multiple antibiotic resistance protein
MLGSGPLGEYLKAGIAIFVLIDPIGAIPIYLSLTPTYTPAEHRRTVRRTAVATTLILLGSLAIGGPALELLGVSIPAFRVAGGLLILLLALGMMRAKPSSARESEQEASEAAEKPDIAVVPMAIPMLSGPGAIGAMIVYGHMKATALNYAVLAVIAVVVGGSTWLALQLAAPIGGRLGRTGVGLLTRIMGLLLAAIAVEMVANGLRDLFPILATAPR